MSDAARLSLASEVRSMARHGGVAELPRKTKPTPEQSKQVAFRLPQSLVDRLEAAGDLLGLDMSNLLRMMIIEKLPEYEDRGRKARGETT